MVDKNNVVEIQRQQQNERRVIEFILHVVQVFTQYKYCQIISINHIRVDERMTAMKRQQ